MLDVLEVKGVPQVVEGTIGVLYVILHHLVALEVLLVAVVDRVVKEVLVIYHQPFWCINIR